MEFVINSLRSGRSSGPVSLISTAGKEWCTLIIPLQAAFYWAGTASLLLPSLQPALPACIWAMNITITISMQCVS